MEGAQQELTKLLEQVEKHYPGVTELLEVYEKAHIQLAPGSSEGPTTGSNTSDFE